MQNFDWRGNQKQKLQKSSCKKLLCKFENNLVNWFWSEPLPKYFLLFLLVEKHVRQGGMASFSYVNKQMNMFLAHLSRRAERDHMFYTDKWRFNILLILST